MILLKCCSFNPRKHRRTPSQSKWLFPNVMPTFAKVTAKAERRGTGSNWLLLVFAVWLTVFPLLLEAPAGFQEKSTGRNIYNHKASFHHTGRNIQKSRRACLLFSSLQLWCRLPRRCVHDNIRSNKLVIVRPSDSNSSNDQANNVVACFCFMLLALGPQSLVEVDWLCVGIAGGVRGLAAWIGSNACRSYLWEASLRLRCLACLIDEWMATYCTAKVHFFLSRTSYNVWRLIVPKCTSSRAVSCMSKSFAFSVVFVNWNHYWDVTCCLLSACAWMPIGAQLVRQPLIDR